VEALVALVERLCVDAEDDLRSPRFAFGFGEHDAVEAVRQLVVDRGIASWPSRAGQLTTAFGQAILLGRELPGGWPFVRVVLLCSGSYPGRDLLMRLPLGTRVVLVFDPHDPPDDAEELRRLVYEDGAGFFVKPSS
jgi:hypothetical protein